ncbi:MAG: hypothetical protein LJE61_14825, partial [Thiocapsa sp.]
ALALHPGHGGAACPGCGAGAVASIAIIVLVVITVEAALLDQGGHLAVQTLDQLLGACLS